MNSHIKAFIRQAEANGTLDEIQEMMLKRYAEEWLISNTPEEREKIFVKTQVIGETITELLSIIDTESGD